MGRTPPRDARLVAPAHAKLPPAIRSAGARRSSTSTCGPRRPRRRSSKRRGSSPRFAPSANLGLDPAAPAPGWAPPEGGPHPRLAVNYERSVGVVLG